MEKFKKLVIIGDGAFAEVAYEYFTEDSEYEVVGFAVEAAYLNKTELFGLPIVELEQVVKHFKPDETEFYAALVYNQLNRLRKRIYMSVKGMGYRPASYISSRAFVWKNAEIGEHCFIFEDNTVQPFVKIGNNVVLWSGNHIGHHSKIADNCFISSHVVISGFCEIGENSFLGVNSTLANNVTVAKDNWIAPGVVLSKGTEPGVLYKAPVPEVAGVSAPRFFKVRE
jgi:sugar O-acyltransferase (sialic acid O-acetyltransferase NeuD family)